MENQSLTIAIIDDNEAIRKSLQILLDFSGYETRTFATAEACLESDISEIDCFVIDLRLPEMNGYELAKYIRQDGFDTPMIVMSGNIDAPEYVDLRQIKNVKCLPKP